MNIRLTGINAADSRTIKASFTNDLDPTLNAQNVLVNGASESTPDALVLNAYVSGNIFIINVLPLTPYVKYIVTFKNSADVAFKDISGSAYLPQDGIANVIEVLGAEDPTNSYRDNLVYDLSGQPYNPDKGTFIRDMFNQLTNGFLKAKHDIRQSKNDNYLSVNVVDERKRRSFGPFDRLSEEGAYEVDRVGLTPENEVLNGTISFDSFPFDIITVQGVPVNDERLTAGFGPGYFDQFTLSMTKYPVTKLSSVVFYYQDGSSYTYDIRTYGYRIFEPKYDTAYASTLLTLEENQFQLNDDILNDTSFQTPESGDYVIVSYEYKSLGKFIDADSVQVSQVLSAVRQATPALANEFSLLHSPIVSVNDVIPSSGGVIFLDPSSDTPFQTIHPAFQNEIPFRLQSLPRFPGEYSIDYANGRVFVYGAVTDDGTGNFPPAATYYYRNTFRPDLDYTYRTDTSELVASPIRDLIGQTARITFLYEHVLVPGIDYKTGIHEEVLDERVENRILTSNSVRVLHAPITNVFKVFNETTGEIYPLTSFNNDVVTFETSTPPNISTAKFERATFESQLNEQLIFSQEYTNALGTRVFKFNLLGSNIISATEDAIASSYNTSAGFSRNDLFETELFYNQLTTSSVNTDRLVIGQYQIDYVNGIVYVGVSSGQDFGLGTISYKQPVIDPVHPHVIAVEAVFYSLNPSNGITKQLNYSSFGEGNITPNIFDVSFEQFLNGDTSLPYIVSNDRITVTDDIKTVRHVFDSYDLNNNLNPIDFGINATYVGNVIILDPNGVEVEPAIDVVSGGLDVILTMPSSGISLKNALSVVRLSDNQELLDGYQTISGDTITLSATSGASPGDIVSVIYSVVLNTLAQPVVDYNRGEYYANYTYLADEIIVAYEFGDNVLDFRESVTLNPGQDYFVNYKVGALRDSLLANFGSLIDIPKINTFETNLARERYRDVLIGALQSFTKGPTVPSMKALVSAVTKIDPQIIEAAFHYWALGISPLFMTEFVVNGTPQFVPGRFDGAYLPTASGDSITFPVSSNLRLNEGTMEMTVRPEWDGLDNDATITFSNLSRDGYALTETQIFIGSTSMNPTIEDGEFSINRFDVPSPMGLPSKIFTETGMFIYYDEQEKRWKVLAKDTPDGYVYTGSIVSSGEVYDVKFIPGLEDLYDMKRSTETTIEFEFHLNSGDVPNDGYGTTDGYVPGYSFDGISFMADDLHYFFDFAQTETRNRFSLFKDGRGYLNFVVWDNGDSLFYPKGRRTSYTVSADVQSWRSGEEHNIGLAWKLNTKDKQDEMHLFIDGFEVPNIMRYGGIPSGTSDDRFRTVKPELVVGTVPKNAIAGNMLSTTQGSAIVTATGVDFGIGGIVPGDTIEIQEVGFTTYTILSVAGAALTLNGAMPATLSDARFTVNPYSAVVSSEIDIYNNIAVSTLLGGVETEIPGLRATVPGYSISKNSLNQNVLTILGDALAGSQILIRTLGLNHRRCREKVYLWNDQAVLRTQLPPPINLDEVSIRSVILPYVVVGPDNATIVGADFDITLYPTEVSNDVEGRQLEVRIAGGNVDFTTPTTVTINGTSSGGATEVLSFSAPGKKLSVNKWMTITSVDVVTTPITLSLNGAGIEIKEAYSVTTPNGNNIYPVIRFGFQTQSGLTLEGDGSDIVTDANGFFAASEVNNILVIESPAGVVGSYKIIEKIDNTTIRLQTPTGLAFANGIYKIFNITIGRSGFQNGFFFLEKAGTVNTPYDLPLGYYEFDYSTYLSVIFNTTSDLTAYLGSDFHGLNQAKAVIDEFRILSNQLTDTRVGETIALNQESITVDAVRLRPFRTNAQTLVLLHLNEFPVINDAGYVTYADRSFIQSSTSVNANFGQSICITDKGLGFDNKGVLTTASQGTVEFWVSPMYDTYNDPVPRVYFDASAAVVDNVTSLTRGTVKIDSRIGTVLSVRLQSDVNQTGINYYAGGSLESDFQTIKLGQALPYQQTPVTVSYVPSGVVGDRLTILKDSAGYISFNVFANGELYQVRQPVFWARDTWHRVKATFKFNTQNNLDEIRLFIDGEERGSVRFGDNVLFGNNITFGATVTGVTDQILVANIDFRDLITRFYIGQDYTGSFPAHARIDNLRISDKALTSNIIMGQPKDVDFSSNLENIFPVIENAYTTLLLNFDRISQEVEDFSLLRDPAYGIFNFTLNIIDSFDIVADSAIVQSMLEAMIYALKPANSKVDINYIR